LPGPRLEFGGSYQHLLQGDRSNAFGFHFAWQPLALPLDLRAEYARSHNGSGYWVESAYRLSQAPVWQHELRHVQVVGRMQQYFVGTVPDVNLPTVNTRLFEFGVNYYFRDDVRLVSSYGRQFASNAGGITGNMNQWTVGITYRLALPVGHGDMP
jgi:predicted porin